MGKQASSTGRVDGRRPVRRLTIATVAMSCDLSSEVNRARITDHVVRIHSQHPDVRLVHFGETILGWYFKKGETAAYHRRIAEPIPGPSTDALAALARAHDIYLSFGMTERAGDAIHNSQVLIAPDGKVLAVHRKLCPKDPVFAPGDQFLTTADVDGARVALIICADVQNFRVLRAIRRARVDVVLAGLADTGAELSIARIVGCLFDAWSITANRFGLEGSTFWPGLISVVDPIGWVRGHAVDKEQVLVETLRIGSNRVLPRVARRFVAAARLFGLPFALIGQTAARRLARLWRGAPRDAA
jgi:predicted amidohydrolase